MVKYLAPGRTPKVFSGESAIASAKEALAKDVESDLRVWLTHDYGDGEKVVEYEVCGKDVSWLSKYSEILEKFARCCQREGDSMKIDEHLRIEIATPESFIMNDYDDLLGEVNEFRYEFFEIE